MKHNFSFLPSLRRTTLLALLLFGTTAAFSETETVYYICFQRDKGYPGSRTGEPMARDLYMQDKGNGVVEYVQQASNPADDSYKWRRISQGDYNVGNTKCDVYYLQNVGTGEYLYCSDDVASGDWAYRTTATGDNEQNDHYRWMFYPNGQDGGYELFMIASRYDVQFDYKDGNPNFFKIRHLHSCNQYNNCTDTYANIPKIPCGSQTDHNGYTDAKIIPVEYTPPTPACVNCGTVQAK